MQFIRFVITFSAILLFGACSKSDDPSSGGQNNGQNQPPAVVAVTGVSLNKTELALTEGDSESLTVTVLPENATDKTVSWSSSDASVAKVENGKVTGMKAGTATISAKAGDKSATCTVTVKAKVIAVHSVSLNKTELTLIEGHTETLTATVLPENATDKTVSWSSSDASVAKVENGKVTGVKDGRATITARAGDKSATCTVKVIPEDIDGGHEGTGEEKWD